MTAAALQHSCSPSVRDRRVVEHLPLARKLALRLAGKVPPSIDLDDLVAAATMGLLDAAERFEEARGIPFEAYARTRIHGAVLDALRANDHLGRKERRREREGGAAEQKLTASLGRELTSSERAEARGGAAPALSHASAFVSIDDCELPAPAASCDPFAALARGELRTQLVDAIGQLGEREQVILSLYYERDLTYREIGAVLQVTESRVCQLLRAVHGKLRGALADWS
jgi:RNA polymerase sigma factor for flagellar operon FliA